jgi:hypothetical protein
MMPAFAFAETCSVWKNEKDSFRMIPGKFRAKEWTGKVSVKKIQLASTDYREKLVRDSAHLNINRATISLSAHVKR